MASGRTGGGDIGVLCPLYRAILEGQRGTPSVSVGLRLVRIRGEPATTHSVASHVAVSVPNILLDVNRGTP
jgi:hypothetical protein